MAIVQNFAYDVLKKDEIRIYGFRMPILTLPGFRMNLLPVYALDLGLAHLAVFG